MYDMCSRGGSKRFDSVILLSEKIECGVCVFARFRRCQKGICILAFKIWLGIESESMSMARPQRASRSEPKKCRRWRGAVQGSKNRRHDWRFT